ncbi:MAG TPA: hypothetical protein VFP63_07585 [Dehalococcoidia bacterium]|nr:hypothetical protein [Dehalococcoidia bacterium]
MSQTSSRERWFEPFAGHHPAVFIATERVLPEADPDEDLLLEALAAAGVEPRLATWSDDGIDWSAGALTVIRSTWDYHHQREEFVDWAERVGGRTQLWNPAPVVRWNSHKGYLLRLADAGVPVVPTVLLRQGAPANLAEIMSQRGWMRVVVKPAVSASSYRTLHAGAETIDEGDAHLRELLAERDALVQPYVASVEDYGERAVIWIDGRFSHAVRKSPRFSADDEAVSEALPIAEDERLVAERTLAAVNEPLLYARIDLARDSDGRPQVMELELIEPSLYLLQSPDALSRLVSAISARARTA